MEQLPQTATEYLTLGPSTQTSIDIFSDGVIESVQAGEISPLAVLVQIRAMEKAFERILKETKDNLMREADRYPGTEFEFQGNKITKAEHGTRYDFSGCGDLKWSELKAKEAMIKSSITERENFLKAIKGELETLDKATSEVITLRPPTKKSISGLNVSIK